MSQASDRSDRGFHVSDDYLIVIPTRVCDPDWHRHPAHCKYLFFTCVSLISCDIRVSQAFKGVTVDLDSLVDLLESIEDILKHLDIYTKVPPTPAMTEIVMKIFVELLSTLALATKQIRQGQLSGSILADALPDSMQRREICEQTFRRE
jgi:hypothetical protein